ncbi:MAG TPA: diguanylate cyclase [Polyangia bacterium]|nr:diguanylate cyclase [Polyangia bacterium]
MDSDVIMKDDNENASEATYEAVSEGASEAKRILVVEDERIIARDICKTLEEMGYVVCGTARSSNEALDQAAAHRPALVLMDIRIAGQMDGVEAAAEIKRRHQVPIVFLTGNTDESTLQRAFRSQPDGYLSKPFTRATLRSAIEVAIQRHGVEERLRRMNEELAAQKLQLEKRADELGMLSEMGDFLQLCDSADEVLAIVARFGRQLFPDDSGALYLLDGSGDSLTAATTWGQGPIQPGFDLDGCRALRRGHTHRVVPPEDQLRCAHFEASTSIASVCVPMMTNGTSHGVLSVSFPFAGLHASAIWAKEQLTTVLAQRISLTLTNLRIKEQLKRESILDPLTGLYNRRYMTSAFDRELRLASRTNRPIGVIIFDVDGFKQVNDQFGHAAADRALCELAKLLRSRIRAYDVPIRYGGDEVVVLLPDTTLDGARAVADKLLQSVRNQEIRHRGSIIPISISVGVAAYPLHGRNPESILRAADLALYRAKAEGRDRVVVAEDDAPSSPDVKPPPECAREETGLPGQRDPFPPQAPA